MTDEEFEHELEQLNRMLRNLREIKDKQMRRELKAAARYLAVKLSRN